LHVELSLVKLCNIITTQKKKPDELNIVQEEEAEFKNDIKQKETNTPVPEKRNIISNRANTEIKKDSLPETTKTEKKSTISIKAALSGFANVQSQSVKKEENLTDEKVSEFHAEAFDTEKLRIKWNEYAEQIKSKSMRMHIVLKNKQPELQDDYKIFIKMDNSAQEEEFNKEIKPDLILFLRKELRNDKLELNTIIESSEDAPKRAYTDHDKFEMMSLKNPVLSKLKTDLNLDFE
jgi:hypothetical protein